MEMEELEGLTPEEERALLQEKVAEVRAAIAKMEENQRKLPYNPETAQLREMMGKLLSEMQRMEQNMLSLLRLDEENTDSSEGGKNHGGHQVEGK